MCNCKNESGQRTPYCCNFCSCVDWSDSEQSEQWVRHLYENFIPERDVLTYSALESLDSEPAVLCVLGRCKICGRQICSGRTLKDAQTFDVLMKCLFHEIMCCDKGDGTKLEDAVVRILREEDRGRALDWIYLNRDRAADNRFNNVKPHFNMNVHHVPGYEFKLSKNLRIWEEEGDDNFAELAELATADIHWLKEQRGIRVRQEKVVAQKIDEYSDKWNRYALETRMFIEAVEIAETERPRHTGNQWVQTEDGRITVHEISNAVYKMRIWVQPPATIVLPAWNVWCELAVNPLPKNKHKFGHKKIYEEYRNQITYDADVEKYVAELKNAYADYFTEEFPPIPEKYADYFKVNDVLLTDYTIEHKK